MATFQKRNGRITATVRIKPHSAKSKTFNTKREAKAWADETEIKLKNEKEKIFTHITLRQAIEEYRDTVSINKKGGVKEVTRLNQFIKIMNVDVSLSDIDKEFLVNFREYRLESVVPATARRELLMLSGLFSWCIDKKLWLTSSPMDGVKLPKASNHREKVISDYEKETLIPYLNQELKNIFLIALETGMRLSEICLLEWERVFLDKQFLVLRSTKNGRPREVPLSVYAVNIFRGIGVKKSGRIFSYEPKYASADFMKARIKAELYDFTFHDTRHTAATHIAPKLPLLDLCKMFGWTDPKRAMVYYNPTSSQIAARLSLP